MKTLILFCLVLCASITYSTGTFINTGNYEFTIVSELYCGVKERNQPQINKNTNLEKIEGISQDVVK